MKPMRSGGGWKAIGYSLRLARRVGWRRMWQALRSKNACKTCAVGMGGQLGGMVNEGGHFPEVCKKSFQAMASDLQAAVQPGFFERFDLPRLRALSSRELEHSGRLTTPLVLEAGSKNYRPIEWREAIDQIVAKLREAGPQRSFFYASGRSSNEAGFLLQLTARLFGTNYVNNCSYYCHQASGVGLGSAIGTGTGTLRLEDLDHCDLYILIGANPASNHPRLMRTLMQIRRRGGEVIVVNPVRELGLINFRVPSDVRSLLFGSKIASRYVQPHIGGDLALLTGMAKVVLERGGHDAAFIAAHTEGFDDFRRQVEATTWDEIVAGSGVDRETIVQVAESYLKAKNAVIGWAMGITHHLHGTQTVQAVANLALLRGMVGRRNAGVMPIRGHSNVQGMGSVGVAPNLKKAILERFEQRLGFTPPTSPGYDTMACMDAADRGEMDVAFCLGGNLYGSNPHARFATEALGKVGLVVYLSTTLNTGHAWGTGRETLILPVLPRDEEPQPTTQESMFSYLRLSDGGPARFDGPRSEVSILAEIGRGLFGKDGPVDWTELESHAAIRRLIGELIPEYESISRIDRAPDNGKKAEKEFHIPGRAVEEYRFPTATGKGKFHAIALPAAQGEFAGSATQPGGTPSAGANGENGALRVMTIRSEGQFNTVVYDEEDIYRGQERRDVILMNASDIAGRGLQPDQRVRVQSEAGELRHLLVRPFDIRPGNALMYYPEANVLVPKTVDPLSKTPGFKGFRVTVCPED
jgi:molybdopterin-dependent oxidoreductase alpha subunit